MFRTLIAATLSLALVLPATTAPAHADSKDIAKVLGGLAALYILKEALDRDRNQSAVHSQRNPVIVRPTHPHRRPGARPGNGHRRDVRILPRDCYVTLRTSRGHVSGYGARCMQNAVARPGTLPPQCIRQFRTHRGLRNLYGPRCLANEGWSTRTARR